MTSMMQWQGNRKFRKDCEVAAARIPNPDAIMVGVLELSETQAGLRGGALIIQEQEVLALPAGLAAVPALQNQPEFPLAPQLEAAQGPLRMIREMMDHEARRGERPTYRKPYLAYIDQMPLPPSFKVPNFTLLGFLGIPYLDKPLQEVTISDLAALKQSEDEPAQDFIIRTTEEKNSSKGTCYKTPSSSVHLVEVESEDGQESPEEMEVAVAEMAKLKHPISCKALTKTPKDQKPPLFTGDFVPNNPAHNKIYSFDLTKVDAMFDEMLLQKAIETPHRLPKLEEFKGRQLKLDEKPPTVTEYPFPQPQVNMQDRAEEDDQENWTEEYEEKQVEYRGEQDEETQAFGAELESLLQGDLGIKMVFLLLEKFRGAE
ncbi:unnamed protein product [Prunus brigantina]